MRQQTCLDCIDKPKWIVQTTHMQSSPMFHHWCVHQKSCLAPARSGLERRRTSFCFAQKGDNIIASSPNHRCQLLAKCWALLVSWWAGMLGLLQCTRIWLYEDVLSSFPNGRHWLLLSPPPPPPLLNKNYALYWIVDRQSTGFLREHNSPMTISLLNNAILHRHGFYLEDFLAFSRKDST